MRLLNVSVCLLLEDSISQAMSNFEYAILRSSASHARPTSIQLIGPNELKDGILRRAKEFHAGSRRMNNLSFKEQTCDLEFPDATRIDIILNWIDDSGWELVNVARSDTKETYSPMQNLRRFRGPDS